MNRIVIFLTALLLNTAFANTVTLSLSDAVRLTLKNLPSINAAQLGVQSATERANAAHNSWYPVIGAEATYGRSIPSYEFNFAGKSLKLSPDNVYDINAGVNWEIFDFGKRAAAEKVEKAGIEQANAHTETIVNTVTFQIVTLYKSIDYYKQAITVQDALIAALSAHKDFVKRQVESGNAVSFDILKTDVRISGAQSQRINFVNEYERRLCILRNMTQTPDTDSIELQVNGTYLPPCIGVNDSCTAFINRTEIKQAIAALHIAEQTAQATKLANNPSIATHVSAGIKDGYAETHGEEITMESPTPNAGIGVKINVPIWDGNRLASRKKLAQYAVDLAVNNVNDVKRQIIQEIKTAQIDCLASWEQLHIAESIVSQTDSLANAALTRYESGVATNLEYLDSQADRAQAQMNLAGCRYRYLVNDLSLKQALGKALF